MKIVLVADNHGDRKCLEYLKETYADYDLFVHCGDSEMPFEEMKGFVCVSGNNDFQYGPAVQDQVILHAGGHNIYICHGHMDFLSYFHYEPLAKRAKAKGCDVVFFGHVHVYCDQMVDGVRLLNPGSIRHNRDGTQPSYMLVEISDGEITTIHKTYGEKKKPDFWSRLFGIQ